MQDNPYIRLVDSSPVDGSPLLSTQLRASSPHSGFPKGALGLPLKVILEPDFKKLTGVRKAAFLHPSGGLLPPRAMN